MDNSNKKKRLPKELQDYKKEIKALPFKDRVKAYFDCSSFTNDIDKYKKEIILKSFSKEEKAEYYRTYSPIYSSIEKFGDRIRAINANRIIYANYIQEALRRMDTFYYTADFLNLVTPKVEGALEKAMGEDAREELTEALRILKRYRRVSIQAPPISFNEERGMYEVPTEKEKEFLLGAIQTLKGILSLIKCYLEALREFLEWVGYPELFPIEFYNMEEELITSFRPIPRNPQKSPDADKFPLHFAENEVEKSFLSIDYQALPRTIDIFKDRNLFANAYRSFFDY